MAKEAEIDGGRRRGVPWRILGWGMAALLLLLPYIANAPWTVSDFVLAAMMLGSVGIAFELIVRKSGSLAFRSAAALAVIAVFLTIWVNGAVGMIGSEDNPYNFLFLGVLLIALGGAIAARLEPEGMRRAMIASAIVQGTLAVGGMPTDLRGGIFAASFAGLWLLSAVLFGNAARGRADTNGGAA